MEESFNETLTEGNFIQIKNLRKQVEVPSKAFDMSFSNLKLE